jgi:2-dehydropantoate 2-reductase
MNIDLLVNKRSNNILKNKKPKIVIIGQGAIGLLFYYHLQQTKNHVSLLCSAFSSTFSSEQSERPSRFIASKERAEYSFTAYQATRASYHQLLYSQADDIKQADIIILCVKSYQVVAAIKSIAFAINRSCLVILAHNGMGTLSEVKQLLPVKQRVLTMLTTHGCLRNSPLNITHTGLGHSDIGLLAGAMTKTEKSSLTQLLNQAIATFTFEQNIINKQWLKLAINCVINPITALNNIENGQVNLTEFKEIKANLITEIVEIAKAEGVDLTEKELTKTIQTVSQATAKNSSSMRCDIVAKRQTEIDYINGYIHRLGIKHCIATPINTQMWQAIKKIE